MTQVQDVTTKKKVSQFDEDVLQTGSCACTAERLSSSIAKSINGNSLLAGHILWDR